MLPHGVLLLSAPVSHILFYRTSFHFIPNSNKVFCTQNLGSSKTDATSLLCVDGATLAVLVQALGRIGFTIGRRTKRRRRALSN